MTKKFHRSIIITGLTLAALFLFIACQSNAAPSPEEAAVQPTSNALAEVHTNTEDQSSQSQESANEPITDECTLCHANKDLLIDTAKPEEEVIAENEGAG